jgi:cytochrome c heme-lyase
MDAPSESQSLAAMARKDHGLQAKDMKVIVPIHNAVNERTWYEILRWGEGRGSDVCGGSKLVSFKGKSQELSPRARFKSLLGSVVAPLLSVPHAVSHWHSLDTRPHLTDMTG